MQLEEFIGNHKQIKVLVDWLNICYHEPTTETSNYCIVYGPPGNGKTLLVELLAKEFSVELFKITPLDSTGILDIIKSVNIKTFDGTNHKLILVDDLDEFPSRVTKQLIKIAEISNHPIIYTCKVVPAYQDAFVNGSLKDIKERLIWIRKPLTSEILDYLKSISNLPIETLDKIARESKSVRSAVLSIQNQSVNDLTNPTDSLIDTFRKLNNRCIDKVFNRYDITKVFNSIKGYDKDALRVMAKFAEFDFRATCKFEDIDPVFLNEMAEPIEKVEFENKKKNNSNKIKIEKPKELIKKEQNKMVSVNHWL